MSNARVFDREAEELGTFTRKEITERLHNTADWDGRDAYVRDCIRDRINKNVIEDENGIYRFVAHSEKISNANHPTNAQRANRNTRKGAISINEDLPQEVTRDESGLIILNATNAAIVGLHCIVSLSNFVFDVSFLYQKDK